MPKCGGRRYGVHVGQRPAPAHSVERDDHLRGARQGLHRAPSRRPASICAAPTRGWRHRPAHRAPADARRHGGRADAGPPVRGRQAPASSAGLTNYWGYNSIGFFAPDSRYASARDAGRAGRRVQGDGEGAARGGHRGHPRRRLQPHRRGQPPRARRSASAASTTPPTTGWCRRPRATTWTTPGCGNTLNMTHPRTLQLIMDSLRYWVQEMHVDGFRFDLASALARELHDVDRLGAVLRHHPPGPGALAGEADRRAVGPRRGRLPGRQLPGRCGRSGTARTATPCARFWKGDEGQVGELGLPPDRLAATCTSAAAGGRTPASTSSPRTTASRCTTSSATTTSTTRPTARTTATAHDDNHSWNCGVEGPTDDPAIVALRERQKRNFLATLLLSQGVPMLLRRRRDRPHAAAATTTPTARTTRSPGSTGASIEPPQGAARVHAQPDPRCAGSIRSSRRKQFFYGRAHPGSEVKDLRGSGPTARR